MRVIGLTGSIACGKSTVSQALISRGYPVIDGDAVSHRLTAENGPALPAIRQTFGPSFFLPDGRLDRKKLGSLVFRNDRARAALDDLMAPLLRNAILNALQEARDRSAALCFMDLPLLFEKGYDELCDSVWCVTLPLSLQLERLMQRDRCTEEEAMSRIRSVLSSEEKAELSDFVIDNSGTVEETLAQMDRGLERELAAVRPRPARARRMDRYTEASDPEPAPVPDPVPAPVPGPPPGPVSAPVSDPAPEPGQDPSRLPSPPPPGSGIARSTDMTRRPARRKAAWKMPVWLRTVLIVLSFALLIAFTAQCLMRGYLARQAALHEAEQKNIDANYPVLYQDLIERQAAVYNLNPAYVTSLIRNESSFRPQAESSVGARGLMQLMPDTAEWIAGKLKTEGYAFERMFDPESNITFGCWYLNYLSRLFGGDVICVTCAYHAGQGTVTSWLSDSRYSPDGVHLSLELLPEGPTRLYAERVTRDYGIYQKKVYAPADGSDDGGSPAVS